MKSGMPVRSMTIQERISTKRTSCVPGHTAVPHSTFHFKKLMKKCNIDCTKHVWHDLRHTYATLLDQNNINMKVVSEILGHYSEEFTNEVYVIHKPEVIIYDTSEVMNSFIESLKLDSTERTIPVYDISFIQEYLF